MEQTAEAKICPPHAFRGLDAKCRHCGKLKSEVMPAPTASDDGPQPEADEQGCPPHQFRGVEAKCSKCGTVKGTDWTPPEFTRETIASDYRCDQCNTPMPPLSVMYRHGRAFLCGECHDARETADDCQCVICGEQIAAGETCGDGRSKCARTLRRRAERQAEMAHED